MTAPEIIKQLVERFDQHREAYRAGKYNETQLRTEFLNPFLEALGWDVLNKLGYSEENKHVIHEDSLDVEGMKKAPDYAFKIGKERKFFVEAKKPSVKIETNAEVAFQLKRYVWSAKLPLGILTDFEEFAVYECRSKPKVSDSVKTGRVMLLKYTDYVEKWDEIAAVFSHEAVMTGGFDKFANSAAKKKGTAEVDAAFLDEIEGWRETLAKNMALRNKPKVGSEADLNYAVQMTIDRMIFLRICEERGYESEFQLQEISKRENVYGELKKLFERADKRYNSGLFHFKDEKGRGRADTFTTGLEIDDKVLKEVIKDLYYPSPYVFSQIPADILGQIYEQFLGKVIRLTAGGSAKVEEKPEVRKAGGVYYTPTFIVLYIIINTLGKLLSGESGVGNRRLGIGMTPKEAALLKILDPACGSGTFLLGAYQYLLDWHLDWYMNNDFEKWSKGRNAVLVQAKDSWKLSVEKKKEILLNNIYGVDIDPQAVEVTKLSLLLKVIEDPGQLSLLDERILPDLGKNIQCGNSLIGPDYFEGQLMVSEDERARVNAFDWKAAFPEVFAQGGFDAVVGNPPYGAYLFDSEKDYLFSNYVCQNYQLDTYLLFLEKSIKSLLRENGYFGMIIPNPWMTNLLQTTTRKFAVENTRVNEIVHFKFPVFKKVTVDTQVVILQKGTAKGWSPTATIVEHQNDLLTGENLQHIVHSQDKWRSLNGGVINIFMKPEQLDLAEKIKNACVDLESLFDINVGIKPYQVGKGKPSQTRQTVETRPFDSNKKLDSSFRSYLRGSDIRRYKIDPLESRFLKYGSWLAEPRPAANFDAPEKILMRQTGDSIVATLDVEQYLCLNNMHVIVPKNIPYSIKYVLGVLDSKIVNWYYHSLNPEVGEALAEVKKTNVAKLPIRPINFSDLAEKAQHDKMVSLVERMLALQKSLKSTVNPQEADRLAREVESTDRAIDGLVYQLYGLTENEVKIVEER
jgi:type I restriction-modification system DNA methylase subunit